MTAVILYISRENRSAAFLLCVSSIFLHLLFTEFSEHYQVL